MKKTASLALALVLLSCITFSDDALARSGGKSRGGSYKSGKVSPKSNPSNPSNNSGSGSSSKSNGANNNNSTSTGNSTSSSAATTIRTTIHWKDKGTIILSQDRANIERYRQLKNKLDILRSTPNIGRLTLALTALQGVALNLNDCGQDIIETRKENIVSYETWTELSIKSTERSNFSNCVESSEVTMTGASLLIEDYKADLSLFNNINSQLRELERIKISYSAYKVGQQVKLVPASDSLQQLLNSNGALFKQEGAKVKRFIDSYQNSIQLVDNLEDLLDLYEGKKTALLNVIVPLSNTNQEEEDTKLKELLSLENKLTQEVTKAKVKALNLEGEKNLNIIRQNTSILEGQLNSDLIKVLTGINRSLEQVNLLKNTFPSTVEFGKLQTKLKGLVKSIDSSSTEELKAELAAVNKKIEENKWQVGWRKNVVLGGKLLLLLLIGGVGIPLLLNSEFLIGKTKDLPTMRTWFDVYERWQDMLDTRIRSSYALRLQKAEFDRIFNGTITVDSFLTRIYFDRESSAETNKLYLGLIKKEEELGQLILAALQTSGIVLDSKVNENITISSKLIEEALTSYKEVDPKIEEVINYHYCDTLTSLLKEAQTNLYRVECELTKEAEEYAEKELIDKDKYTKAKWFICQGYLAWQAGKVLYETFEPYSKIDLPLHLILTGLNDEHQQNLLECIKREGNDWGFTFTDTEFNKLNKYVPTPPDSTYTLEEIRNELEKLDKELVSSRIEFNAMFNEINDLLKWFTFMAIRYSELSGWDITEPEPLSKAQIKKWKNLFPNNSEVLSLLNKVS